MIKNGSPASLQLRSFIRGNWDASHKQTHTHINMQYTQLTVMHTYPPAIANKFKILLSAESWRMMQFFFSLSHCNIFINQSSTADGFSRECDAGLNPKIRSSLT